MRRSRKAVRTKDNTLVEGPLRHEERPRMLRWPLVGIGRCQCEPSRRSHNSLTISNRGIVAKTHDNQNQVKRRNEP